MRSFRLVGLDPRPFDPLFELADPELEARHIRRVRADSDFGFPCRIGLEDARLGEELLLLAFEHQPAASPYRASGPIYVRRHSRPAQLAAGEVPAYVSRRLISLRAYDAQHLITAAEVVEGDAVAQRLSAMFGDPGVRYVHLHNAKRGCFSCAALPARPGACPRDPDSPASMDTAAAVRILSLCVVLACAETLHGIVRTVLVVPRIGKEKALKLSIVSGSLLAFAICWWLVPAIGLQSLPQHLMLGALLAAFMASFDVAVGRWLMRKSWRKIRPDFDPRTGNYLVLGLAFLVFVPSLVALLKGLP